MKKIGKRCPTCGGLMYESVGNDSNDYYVCSVCQTKVRIFHERIKPSHQKIDIDNRFNHDIDTTGCS